MGTDERWWVGARSTDVGMSVKHTLDRHGTARTMTTLRSASICATLSLFRVQVAPHSARSPSLSLSSASVGSHFWLRREKVRLQMAMSLLQPFTTRLSNNEPLHTTTTTHIRVTTTNTSHTEHLSSDSYCIYQSTKPIDESNKSKKHERA